MIIDSSAIIAVLRNEPDTLAQELNEPLLYKGNDFIHTDILSVDG
jgi:uncharacterized protein with PIN domain